MTKTVATHVTLLIPGCGDQKLSIFLSRLSYNRTRFSRDLCPSSSYLQMDRSGTAVLLQGS
jgi:hypothetical protein